jgi:hypothetical protein
VKLLFPGGAASSKAFPLLAVTVCATESMLSTPTSAPGPTEDGVVKPKSLIVITAADDVAVADPAVAAGELDAAPVDDPVEPQAVTVPRASAHTQDTTALRVGRSGAARPGLAASACRPRWTGASVVDMSRPHFRRQGSPLPVPDPRMA